MLPRFIVRPSYRAGFSGVRRRSPIIVAGSAAAPVDLCQQPSVGARYVPVSARNHCAVDFRGTTIVM
jgi:hypothetical protein